MANPDLRLVGNKLDTFQTTGVQSPASIPPLAPGRKPPDMDAMSERLAKLEGAFDWVKVTVALMGAVLIGGIAFLGVQITRVDDRISALSDKLDSRASAVDSRIAALSEKVDALPDRVNANLRDLINALSQAILASKQTPPQVILMPAPQPAPANPP